MKNKKLSDNIFSKLDFTEEVNNISRYTYSRTFKSVKGESKVR